MIPVRWWSGKDRRARRRRATRVARCAAAALGLAAGCAHRAPEGDRDAPRRVALEPQQSGTAALLQAVSAVDSRVVWVSGHDATYARTTDGGATWHAARVPGADSLEFRDVFAVSAATAYLLAAGPGARSRIYRTDDGGRSWRLQFENADPRAFYDCMDFWDASHGIAVSDAVDGRFPLIATADGGATWVRVDPAALPAAQPGEGAFAASGTCLVARAPGTAWIGTGSAARARVLRTTDRGRTWEAYWTPIHSGATAGITTLAFRDARRGAALGGDIGAPGSQAGTAAITDDGGRTWRPATPPPVPGAVYGAAYAPAARAPALVAVGPRGMSVSRDDGRTWTALDTAAYWAVGFAPSGDGWAVGPRGRITHLKGF